MPKTLSGAPCTMCADAMMHLCQISQRMVAVNLYASGRLCEEKHHKIYLDNYHDIKKYTKELDRVVFDDNKIIDGK